MNESVASYKKLLRLFGLSENKVLLKKKKMFNNWVEENEKEKKKKLLNNSTLGTKQMLGTTFDRP